MSDRTFAQLAYEAWCERRARGKRGRVRFPAWRDLEDAQWDAWQAVIDVVYDRAIRQLGIDLNTSEQAPVVLQYPTDLNPMDTVYYTQNEVDALVETATDEERANVEEEASVKAKDVEKACPACGARDDAESR